jgi:hypothetical protein
VVKNDPSRSFQVALVPMHDLGPTFSLVHSKTRLLGTRVCLSLSEVASDSRIPYCCEDQHSRSYIKVQLLTFFFPNFSWFMFAILNVTLPTSYSRALVSHDPRSQIKRNTACVLFSRHQPWRHSSTGRICCIHIRIHPAPPNTIVKTQQERS